MINFQSVFKSYNGKSGCMCGCNGTYSLPCHTPIEKANASIGYAGYDQEDVSNRRVKIAVNKINNVINFVGPIHPSTLKVYQEESHFISIDDGSRTTTVYFK